MVSQNQILQCRYLVHFMYKKIRKPILEINIIKEMIIESIHGHRIVKRIVLIPFQVMASPAMTDYRKLSRNHRLQEINVPEYR